MICFQENKGYIYYGIGLPLSQANCIFPSHAKTDIQILPRK